MAEFIAEDPGNLTIDCRASFVRAVSLCAELEALCGAAGTSRLLAFVGMARCELTEYGARSPSAYEALTVTSIEEGLRHLEGLLTTLLREADNLPFALSIHEARAIVRDGMRQSI